MNESVIIQKLIQVWQMLERGQLEYSGAEADTKYYLEQYAAFHQPHVVGQREQYHCELYDFGRKDKPCDKQCDGCRAMNLD